MNVAVAGPAGRVLRGLRAILHITQAQHARRVGLSTSRLSRIETAEAVDPDLRMKELIEKTVAIKDLIDAEALVARARYAYLVELGWFSGEQAEEAFAEKHPGQGTVFEIIELGTSERASRCAGHSATRRRCRAVSRQVIPSAKSEELPETPFPS